METINNLYFDTINLDKDLRMVVRNLLQQQEVIELFDGEEIHLVPLESDLKDEVILPSVDIEVIDDGPYDRTQEDIQIQTYSRFTLVLNVYASGKNKRHRAMRLAEMLIRMLQSNQKLNTFYSYGIKLYSNKEISTLTNDVNRRMVRMFALVDNDKKKIYPK